MWPVVFCAIAVLAVVAWRMVDLSVGLGRSRALLHRVDDLIGRGMLAEALAAAREAEVPAAHVIEAGLSRRNLGAAPVSRAFRSAEVLEVARLERGFILLAALATSTPLLGALATVLSMLESPAPEWTAATVAPLGAGIGVALVASVVHLWLVSRVERFAAELRRSTNAGTRVIERLHAVD